MVIIVFEIRKEWQDKNTETNYWFVTKYKLSLSPETKSQKNVIQF